MSRHRIAGPFIALLGMLALAAVPAQAETPPDTLVMAKDIADIITFDPAEAFEITTGELIANVYDRIMTFEPENPRTLTGGVAESHAVSDDGRTITFRIRDGLTFHSGNPVRPQDVEFSLERAVLVDRSPAFIVTQFGWNADNVGELIEVVDDRHVRIPAIGEAIRQTLGKIGIEAQVVTQEGATLWPQYRAREHELILAPWSPDYADPHANADAFARNPDNRPEAKLTGVLAWRNAWARDDLNAAVIRARDELDLERRAQLYLDLQRRLQTEGPYVIMFQQTEQIARRTEVTGFVSGPNFDHVWYRTVTKAGADLGG